MTSSQSAMYFLKQTRILVAAIIAIPLFLLLDSPVGDAWLEPLVFINGQWLANTVVGLVFLLGLKVSSRRARFIMLLGLAVGLAGEVLFSLILGMYQYRFDNVPLWVAFGHGMIFALVYRLARKPWLLQHRQLLQWLLSALIALASVLWLVWQNDLFGFICTVIFFAVLVVAKSSRLFFFFMYWVVVYIELVGTATQCWSWPPTLSHVAWLPASGNPPLGIAVFYFLFDVVVFWLYLNVLNRGAKLRYQRVKRLNNEGVQ